MYGRRVAFDSTRSRRRRQWSGLRRGLFFNGRPAVSLPAPDRFLVALPSTTRGALATPTQLPQDPPDVSRVVPNPTQLLDEIGYAGGGPQAGVVSQTFGT